ncbi:MAG: membrane protein insertase YidC [Clostridiales bacterium]|nr:membrane protein insertase YidC [Clostridiales bacterium]
MQAFYGLFSFIATPMGYLLDFIYGFVGNYGISIIVFTLIVRGCLFPLYASQIKGQLKMAEMQPKMQAIQKKYAGNREEQGRAMQKLYKDEGYNPLMGCLPLLIQMPILMGFFYLLRNPGMFVPGDAIIMASHESFLWLPDLSQPDMWLLPAITGVTTFLSMSMTGMMGGGAAAAGTSDMSAQMAPMMKMMRIFMPIFIFVFGRQMPSGLALYWCMGNLFTIWQTWLLKRMRKRAEAAKKAAEE